MSNACLTFRQAMIWYKGGSYLPDKHALGNSQIILWRSRRTYKREFETMGIG